MSRLLKNAFVPILVTALAACAGDAEEGADTTAAGADSAAMAPSPAPTTPAADQAGQGLLDPETATREQLMAVPGLEAGLADSLVAGRPYENMLAVDSVLAGSLDEQRRDQVYTRLWKPIDLNNASDEEILLIPNLGDRMLREFKEYRPYTAIEQFRREMGKYVDDEEVARLEQYVAVR
jgi:DNA uptake protein ComE-like DNA-binding protein